MKPATALITLIGLANAAAIPRAVVIKNNTNAVSTNSAADPVSDAAQAVHIAQPSSSSDQQTLGNQGGGTVTPENDSDETLLGDKEDNDKSTPSINKRNEFFWASGGGGFGLGRALKGLGKALDKSAEAVEEAASEAAENENQDSGQKQKRVEAMFWGGGLGGLSRAFGRVGKAVEKGAEAVGNTQNEQSSGSS